VAQRDVSKISFIGVRISSRNSSDTVWPISFSSVRYTYTIIMLRYFVSDSFVSIFSVILLKLTFICIVRIVHETVCTWLLFHTIVTICKYFLARHGSRAV
jgi:hypothetical protein